MLKIDLQRCCTADFGVQENAYRASDLRHLFTDMPKLCGHVIWDMYGLFLIESGSGSIYIDEYQLVLDKPAWLFIRPGQHSFFSISDEIYGSAVVFGRGYLPVYGSDAILTTTIYRKKSPPGNTISGDDLRRTQKHFHLLLDEYERNGGAESVASSAYINILLNELLTEASKQECRTDTSPVPEKLIQFGQLLEEYFRTQKLPGYYAERLHITANYLNKMCRTHYGLTAGDLIRERVLSESKRLLCHSDLLVRQIADSLGFESASYFATFFKRGAGITAEDFRIRNRRMYEV